MKMKIWVDHEDIGYIKTKFEKKFDVEVKYVDYDLTSLSMCGIMRLTEIYKKTGLPIIQINNDFMSVEDALEK